MTTGRLIGGKRSTGIRTNTVVPTIAITKQQTMMKYGFLIAKRDIRTFPRCFQQLFWGKPDHPAEIHSATRPRHALAARALKGLRSGWLPPSQAALFALRYDRDRSLSAQRLGRHCARPPESVLPERRICFRE